MVKFGKFTGFAGAIGVAITAVPVTAQDDWRANYSLYGTQGIIDMPTAVAPADGEISSTISVFGDTQRATFTFQVMPRVTGSFRYSLIDTYDRSFDLQYQISDEGQYMPALAVGLRDLLVLGGIAANL